MKLEFDLERTNFVKKSISVKLISLLLVIIMTVTALPIITAAQNGNAAEIELYIKSVKLVQAETAEEARALLEGIGYIFLEENLNEGTEEEGVWLGYTTTADPNEAIYDLKLMNMNGGFTITSMEQMVASQKTAFSEMATDLNYLVEEFLKAYEDESTAAQKAYKALNYFRVVENETVYNEENGLGYQLVSGNMTLDKLTEIILLCNPYFLDSIIKILTMGIQLRRKTDWMTELSVLGPVDSNRDYKLDQQELDRRAKQLLSVLKLYAEAYNEMEEKGITSGELDASFNPIDSQFDFAYKQSASVSDSIQVEKERFRLYKIAFDELKNHSYGASGKTLKDFFCSLEDATDHSVLYPLASILTPGEFASLSYGCFLDLVIGANAKTEDFNNYDETYALLTKDSSSVYLWLGVDKALLDEDSVVGFTETANRHMASTGEYEFYENEQWYEDVWENGFHGALLIGGCGMAVIAAAKLTVGAITIGAALCGASCKVGILAGVVKVCSVIGGIYSFLITLAVVAVVILVSFLISVISKAVNENIDWDDNPIPEYLYDVKEVGFTQTSSNQGIEAGYVRRPVFVLYEAVRDVNDDPIDLNAFSGDQTQWISMYVSYDKQGDDARPIKADSFLVEYGNGVTPEGYTPATRFDEVYAYDLNQWDDEDHVNGIYLFYQQDKDVVVESDVKYYISSVYLQAGESDAHCQRLLEAAGYSYINMNLSPDSEAKGVFSSDKIYTYLGYKVTTNPANALRDLRLIYGPTQGVIQYGGATYSEYGSSAGVTLYGTKYVSAGTPILAGSLGCYHDRDTVPAGFEPVNSFGGGPALSINGVSDGIYLEEEEFLLYFLPDTTYTSGTEYLGGLSYLHCDSVVLSEPLDKAADKVSWRFDEVLGLLKKNTGRDYPYGTEEERHIAMMDYAIIKTGYSYSMTNTSKYNNAVMVYKTYNPYRAVYGFKATSIEDPQPSLIFEQQGYHRWNETCFMAHCLSVGYMEEDGEVFSYFFNYNSSHDPEKVEISGTLYLQGNPSSSNLYNEDTKMMKEKQPIKISDFACIQTGESDSHLTGEDSLFTPVTDVFANSKTAISITTRYKANTNTFRFYSIEDVTEKPYVSSISAIDKLTLYRFYGGAASGLSRDDITDAMLFGQLSAQGANAFCEIRAPMYQDSKWSVFYPIQNEFNAYRFGFTRSESSKEALRDVFLYFGGFSDDGPPDTLYRGEIEYTLLSEIPYNLTGYDGAPAPVVYIYGTYDSDAGARIIDFEVSTEPFKDGYETIRTQNGRSLVSEIQDYMLKQLNSHFMSGAKSVFSQLVDFFAIWKSLKNQENAMFYLHVKREGDDISKQKPYISELYLSVCDYDDRKIEALEDIFDQGAEAYLNVNLNDGTEGKMIYLGYSYTEDPDKAIREIRISHTYFSPSDTSVGSYGIPYKLVSKSNLNEGAGGDSIYMYYTKTEHEVTGLPITGIQLKTSVPKRSWTDTTEYMPVMRWDSWNPSNLNGGTSGTPIYLTTVKPLETPYGTYYEPDFGDDEKYNRNVTKGSATGKYIAALFVMDKNTIRQERIAAGVPSENCRCSMISDEEVFNRLKAMGATTIIRTPICISGDDYGEENANKVFIGYSRTDNLQLAIKDIRINVELLSVAQPAEKIDIDGMTYTLVAEPAKRVTKLPPAISLIGLEDCQDLMLPKLYLYTTKVGTSEPIYDISVDSSPIKNEWNTVISANSIDAYSDICAQAKEHYNLGDKDDSDSYDSEIVYTDELYKWMEDIIDIFDPYEENISPFYIHCKKFEGSSLENVKPYIKEVFVSSGDTIYQAYVNLLAFEPDGFIDYDLNKGASGDYVYLAYKRTDKVDEAITDLVVFEGKNPDKSRIIKIDDHITRYLLVSDCDLNKEAGGDYLYLYSTKDGYRSGPIKSLRIASDPVVSTGLSGPREDTVMLAEGMSKTDVYIDLNEDASGAYIYLIAKHDPRIVSVENGNLIGLPLQPSILVDIPMYMPMTTLPMPASLIGKGSVITVSVLLGLGVVAMLTVLVKKEKDNNKQ